MNIKIEYTNKKLIKKLDLPKGITVFIDGVIGSNFKVNKYINFPLLHSELPTDYTSVECEEINEDYNTWYFYSELTEIKCFNSIETGIKYLSQKDC